MHRRHVCNSHSPLERDAVQPSQPAQNEQPCISTQSQSVFRFRRDRSSANKPPVVLSTFRRRRKPLIDSREYPCALQSVCPDSPCRTHHKNAVPGSNGCWRSADASVAPLGHKIRPISNLTLPESMRKPIGLEREDSALPKTNSACANK